MEDADLPVQMEGKLSESSAGRWWEKWKASGKIISSMFAEFSKVKDQTNDTDWCQGGAGGGEANSLLLTMSKV